ncbi:MAG: amidohydrolase [Acidimicrobiales bacterium]
MSEPTAKLKAAVADSVSTRTERLVSLSHQIHGLAELAFEEEGSAAACAAELAEAGFELELGAGGLPTAFVATTGSGPFVIAICAEYDALPGIGHACGHNVIASAAVGAGSALAGLADDLDITVKVLGTPAEEGGGGKILMMERGAFDGVHAAMMVHPAPVEADRMGCLAVAHYDVAYHGKEAHASAFPERGVNAADALTVSQVAIGLLRQHARRDDQVHGIVTNGGAAPNIVPALTAAKYYIRARSLEALEQWWPRVRSCFEAGATATGASLELVEGGPVYSEFHTDEVMAAFYRGNVEALGRPAPAGAEATMSGSTDMANVSLSIPSIHPLLDIESLPAVNHQPEFARAAAGAAADRAVTDGASAMARTVVDLALDPSERERLMAPGGYRAGPAFR